MWGRKISIDRSLNKNNFEEKTEQGKEDIGCETSYEETSNEFVCAVWATTVGMVWQRQQI